MITLHSHERAYRGRFAPTPSGPLHLGSLLTAVASYLQARSLNGSWQLRIDDLDLARCRTGAAERILRQLDAHALHWDETPRHQRDHIGDYQAALERLRGQGLLYSCHCTRAVLRQSCTAGPDGPVYPGTCREAGFGGRASTRVRITAGSLCFDDGWQGRLCRELDSEVGDFVVRRADGVLSYQLACAVDESAQRITEVVRGADLLGSTFQQRWLQDRLGLAPPAYRHLPVLTDARGRKLSKQNRAAPVDGSRASANLLACLALLGQAPPEELAGARPAEVLRWACAHWRAALVPRAAQMATPIAYNALQQISLAAP